MLAPDSEMVLMDQLDEDSHKSAYEVTQDLKEGIIHAVEVKCVMPYCAVPYRVRPYACIVTERYVIAKYCFIICIPCINAKFIAGYSIVTKVVMTQ
jgi:hypothetical protein